MILHDSRHYQKQLFVFKQMGGFYEDVFRVKATKAPWLLLPYFLFENFQIWSEKTKAPALAEYGNFLILAEVGSAFQDILPLGSPAAVDTVQYQRLQQALERIRNLNSKRKEMKAVWQPAFDQFKAIVQAHQAKEVTSEGDVPNEAVVAKRLDFDDLKTDLAKVRKEIAEALADALELPAPKIKR